MLVLLLQKTRFLRFSIYDINVFNINFGEKCLSAVFGYILSRGHAQEDDDDDDDDG